jgi:hypothetical protein
VILRAHQRRLRPPRDPHGQPPQQLEHSPRLLPPGGPLRSQSRETGHDHDHGSGPAPPC